MNRAMTQSEAAVMQALADKDRAETEYRLLSEKFHEVKIDLERLRGEWVRLREETLRNNILFPVQDYERIVKQYSSEDARTVLVRALEDFYNLNINSTQEPNDRNAEVNGNA